MTAADLDIPSRAASVRTAERIGQATAVEQARAVAEVAAAVQVAQQFPRDIGRVRREMAEACASIELAREAFYAVQNRGEGSTVHLARELASIYGNFQSGVHELRRDDEAGESEVMAWGWDVERNTRASRTFIQPHARMKKVNGRQTRVALVDLHDIYLSNQNTGARALRECIFGNLPKWLVREAEAACRATLEKGDGRPASQRASAAVTAFAGINVTEDQLTLRLGRPRAEWTPQDLASLEVVFMSIRRGETTADEQFPRQRVTASEINATSVDTATGEVTANSLISQTQRGRMFALYQQLGITDRDARLGDTSAFLGRDIDTSTSLTAVEAEALCDWLDTRIRDLNDTDDGETGDDQ